MSEEAGLLMSEQEQAKVETGGLRLSHRDGTQGCMRTHGAEWMARHAAAPVRR